MEGYTSVFNRAINIFAKTADTNALFDSFRSNHEVYGFIDNGDRAPDEEAIAISKSINTELYEKYLAKNEGRAVFGYGGKTPMFSYSNLDSRHIMMSVHLKQNLPNINSIVEIGGGFGNWLRLNTGILEFTDWTIIDLKHLNLLQKWALEKDSLSCTLVESDSYKDWAKTASVDLVIGTHSMSEFSLPVFADYFYNVVMKAKYFYYAYHNSLPAPELIKIKRELIEMNFYPIDSMISQGGNVTNCLYGKKVA